MTHEILVDFLPEQIVTHVIEPYYDVTDLAYHYLYNNELNTTLWEQAFKEHYPATYTIRMYPDLVQHRAVRGEGGSNLTDHNNAGLL